MDSHRARQLARELRSQVERTASRSRTEPVADSVRKLAVAPAC
jgi:hypothetical protein